MSLPWITGIHWLRFENRLNFLFNMTQNDWLGPQSHEELSNRGHVKAFFPSNFNSGFSYDVLHSLLNCWPLRMIPPVVMGNIFILQLVIIGIAGSGSWRFVTIAGWNWLKRKCYTKDILVTALVATRLPWFPVVFSCLSASGTRIGNGEVSSSKIKVAPF